MKDKNDEKWLDELISQSINKEKPQFDAEQWKEKYPAEFETLKSPAGQGITLRPNIWRTIMRSKISKFAAAAIIIAGVSVAVYLAGGLEVTSVAYGISDVPELLRNAKTLHVKGSLTRYVNGQEPISRPLEYWMDFENLRYRKKNHYRDSVWDSTHRMIVDHANKTVTFMRSTPLRLRLYLWRLKAKDVCLKDFYLEPHQLDRFQNTGEEQINGAMFDVWEKKEDWPFTRIVKYWLSPSTGELGRYLNLCDRRGVERYSRHLQDGGKAGRYSFPSVTPGTDEHDWHEHLLTSIERDKPLPDDIFKLEAPVGYTVTTSKDDAPVLGHLGYQTFQTVPGITVTLRYTLSEDGSVILAWSDRNEPMESQAALFEDLVPGGPLPQFTFVPYALHPLHSVHREKNEAITYVGHHLTYTKKGSVFYEWSIYVPDSEPPTKTDFPHVLRYEGRARRNPDDGQIRSMGLGPDATITSAQEFNRLVLDGMAELSDEERPPDGISYESVLELTKQIRESLTH